MNDHSPGPWSWDAERCNLYRATTDEEKRAWTAASGGPAGNITSVLYISDEYGMQPDPADAALIAAAPAMLAMLRELEWADREPTMWKIRTCPSCKGANPEDAGCAISGGHAPGCRLAALLASLP